MKQRPRAVGELQFKLAGRSDEPLLRDFLRRQSLPGWITLSYEREPDFFHAAGIEGDRHQVLLARDERDGRLVAMHTRSVRDVYINGQARRLGYLGQLRTDPDIAAGAWRVRLMRQGFAAGRRCLRADGELPYDLTAIVADNLAARRVLEAGLPGLPRYTPAAAWSTLALSCQAPARHRHAFVIRRASAPDLPVIARLLDRQHARYQLAPIWHEQDLGSQRRCPGLRVEDFLLAEQSGTAVGCIAVWDQRRFKQMVVRGYRFPVDRLRRAFNLLAPWIRMPCLPAPGSVVAQGWLSHLALPDADLGAAFALVEAGIRLARHKGLELVLLGLADAHPALGMLQRRLRPLRYASMLYLVHWPDEMVSLPDLSSRLVHVETALL